MPISIAALAGVQPAEAGLASGLINTSQQIGGALGIAALVDDRDVARRRDQLAAGAAQSQALVDGFTAAFIVGAVIAAVGVVAALTLIRREELGTGARGSSRRSISRPTQSTCSGDPHGSPE